MLSKAKKQEREAHWNTSFQLYVQAAQAFLKLVNAPLSTDGAITNAPSGGAQPQRAEGTRDKDERVQARAHASFALERAQKIKKAYPDLVQLVQRDVFSAGMFFTFCFFLSL